MRRISSLISPRLAFMVGLLAMLPTAARADVGVVTNIGLFGGGSAPINANSTIVEIAYTGNSGVWVYGDAQTATNVTFNGSSVPLYCIDLNHDNTLGSSYAVSSFTNRNGFSANVLNEIAWTAENAGNTGYGPAAAQLLIWSFLDPNFKVINWNGDTGLQAAYNQLVSQMATGYQSSTNYLGHAKFYDAAHVPSASMNQDLVFATPEPSTFVIAGLGSLGLVGYGWRRRARIQGLAMPEGFV